MTEAEAAWLAGLLEGEGCFDFYDNKKQSYPRIRIEMRDEDVIRRVKEICGGGGEVRHIVRTSAKHNDTYFFGMYKRDKVQEVLEQILPWLGERRACKANELLSVLYSQNPAYRC